MSYDSADDLALIRDFFASKAGEGKVKDMTVQMSLWHK